MLLAKSEIVFLANIINLGPRQTSMMELFAKIVNDNCSRKTLHHRCSKRPKYASELTC